MFPLPLCFVEVLWIIGSDGVCVPVCIDKVFIKLLVCEAKYLWEQAFKEKDKVDLMQIV